MNLWARKARLVWLIPALLLFSCEDDLNTIGLDPENNLGIFFVEVPLKDKVSQVWVNDIPSRSTGSILVGNLQYPGFGNVQARNFSQIGISTANIEDSTVFDSLVLQLRVVGLAGENFETTPQSLELFQLVEPVDSAATTYLTSTSQELGMMLGSSEFIVFSDSVGLNVSQTSLNPQDTTDAKIIASNYDESGNYVYTHSIKLDDTFGEDFFLRRRDGGPEFASDSAFTEFFRGIGVVAGNNNSSLITYDALSGFSRLSIFYTELNDDGTSTNREIALPISSFRSYNNISPNINQPWVGSDFDELSNFYEPHVTSTDKAYLQSGTNLLMHVDISDLTQFSDTVDTYIIQSAELVISGLEGVNDFNLPPSRLAYYLTSPDSLAAENYTPDFVHIDLQENVPVIGLYNSDDNEYRISIPQFLETATDSLEFDEMVIVPALISNSILSVDNTQVRGLVVPKENMSIRFFYTIPEQN